MADAGAGRHDAQVREGLLAPAQEPVALGVALVLEGRVHLEGVATGIGVNDDGMVDHEVDRHQGVDPARAPTERLDGVAHCREVDDTRHAGEVLEEDARRRVRDLPGSAAAGLITGQGLHVSRFHARAVLVAQQVLEEELDRVGDPPEIRDLLEGRQAMDAVAPVTDLQGALGAEAVSAVSSGHFVVASKVAL